MKNILHLLVLVIFLPTLNAQTPQLVFTTAVSSGLSSPVDVVNASDGTNRIFVVQRGGIVRVYDASYNLLNATFLTLSGNFTTGGERGLLSLAFHPDYETNRYFFVYYTNGAGGVNIDRFQTLSTNPNQADVSTRTNIMTIPKPVVYSNHNGGKLNFGVDGNLYFGLGDSGSGGDPGNLAQNGNSLWGKMIRINVDNFTTSPFYTIPPTNPYVSDPSILDEIYNIGLRNPWRWSFDRLNGGMWIADVGQNVTEEINHLPFNLSSGVNYGWRCYEGTFAYNTTGCGSQSSYQSPIFEYPRNNTTGGFSVTGGYVYRGSLNSILNGYYICADYVSANGWLIKENSPGNYTTIIQSGLPAQISGFGETENGELLALSLTGVLYSISAVVLLPVKFVSVNVVKLNTTTNTITWKTSNESNLDKYILQQSNDGSNFTDITSIPAQNIATATYTYNHFNNNTSRVFYRIKVIHYNSNPTYSNIITITNSSKNDIAITNISSNNITLFLQNPIKEIVLYGSNGSILFKEMLNGRSGIYSIQAPLSKGAYLIKYVNADDKASTIKFIY